MVVRASEVPASGGEISEKFIFPLRERSIL